MVVVRILGLKPKHVQTPLHFLYLDGVLVGSTTVASNGQLTATMTIAAKQWGADGERVLSADIQRTTAGTAGTKINAIADRHVYVAADVAHWSGAAGSNNVLWFDPETLTYNTRVGQGTLTTAGTNDYVASVGGSRAFAESTAKQPIGSVMANGRIALLMDGDDSLRMTLPTAYTTPAGNGAFYILGAGQSIVNSGSYTWLTSMGGFNIGDGRSLAIGFNGADAMVSSYSGSTFRQTTDLSTVNPTTLFAWVTAALLSPTA